MRPQLKNAAWERVGDELRLVNDPRDQLIVTDPDGTVEKLLQLLSEGGRTIAELAGELALDEAEVRAAVEAFDAQRLLEDGDRLGGLEPADAERYFSNLAFFESFATLERSREDLQERLRHAHVLVLGTGGLNSNTIPHLAGLGVGTMTVLDRDAVEARNFARQYLYRWADIGARKAERAAEWIRAFDPGIKVEAIDADIEGPERVAELIRRTGPDVVASGVDRPNRIDLWVNEACVRAGVPFVRGGMAVTTGTVWSVHPGVSACRACVPADPSNPDDFDNPDDPAIASAIAANRLFGRLPRPNRGIGPVAGLLGAFGAFEVLRYLTGFEPPAYAGRPLTVDFARGCATSQTEWPRDPNCAVCGGR